MQGMSWRLAKYRNRYPFSLAEWLPGKSCWISSGFLWSCVIAASFMCSSYKLQCGLTLGHRDSSHLHLHKTLTSFSVSFSQIPKVLIGKYNHQAPPSPPQTNPCTSTLPLPTWLSWEEKMCTAWTWVRGRSTAPQGSAFTSLCCLCSQIWPQNHTLDSQGWYSLYKHLLSKATLSNCSGMLYFTSEFPEALQGRKKRLRSVDLEFLARMSENTFSCFWSDEHCRQLDYPHRCAPR